MGPEYITSRQNPLMVTVGKILSSRKYRRQTGLFAGDGTKLLREAIRWMPERLDTVILREDLSWPELPEHVRRVCVPAGLMDRISDLETPEGALFLLRLPETREGEIRPGTLVLDGIQDPGNLGTILRTADAMEIPVVLTEGCADPYSPKTVRASMGALFRGEPGYLSREDLINQCRERRIPLMATALSPDARDIREASLGTGAVIIGSEGRGVSRELIEASEGQIIIPMNPRCESLNAAAAAAIVCWQMVQERDMA